MGQFIVNAECQHYTCTGFDADCEVHSSQREVVVFVFMTRNSTCILLIRRLRDCIITSSNYGLTRAEVLHNELDNPLS